MRKSNQHLTWLHHDRMAVSKRLPLACRHEVACAALGSEGLDPETGEIYHLKFRLGNEGSMYTNVDPWPPPFKGLNIRIHIIIPTKGRGCMNQGSTLMELMEH